MSKRVEIITQIYEHFDEDTRVTVSRQGQVEYAVTMDYIHKFLKPDTKVIEIGAGTGQYSIALAKEGYDVTAVELVKKNFDILISHSEGIGNIHAYQGDALDLSRFEDESFDVTLLFGPLYHVYEKDDVNRAIDEAVRVTKKDGVILVAFLSVYAIMHNNYLNETFRDGLKENFTEDFRVRHFEEQFFTGYDIVEFEELFKEKPVKYLKTVAVDGVLETASRRDNFLIKDEDMELFIKYQLKTAEVRELLGASSHLLYICKKNN